MLVTDSYCRDPFVRLLVAAAHLQFSCAFTSMCRPQAISLAPLSTAPSPHTLPPAAALNHLLTVLEAAAGRSVE
jgi:hypothetical protein